MGKNCSATQVFQGSGKSTLMQELLYEYAVHKLEKNKPKPQGVDEITGFENIDKIIDIDQSPIGRTPRSNPATYTDVFTPIRICLRKLMNQRFADINRAGLVSTLKAAAARLVKVTGLLKLK